MNPIYIEYYSHEGCDCYKIDMPWTEYAKDIRVLCKVELGYDYAMQLAIGVLSVYFYKLIITKPKHEEKE